MLYDWLIKMGKQPLVVDACSLLKNPGPASIETLFSFGSLDLLTDTLFFTADNGKVL